MATYKPIRKTASGTEEIKIPYAVLADPPDISGLMPKSGGTFTGNVTFSTVPKVGSSPLALKSDIPTVDTSNLAKLDAENTFTKGQVITGGTSGGYSIDANGYIRGSWLQASSTTNKGSNTGKVCVFDGNGWIYYRTPSEILSEASGVPKSAFSLSGTTLTITI